MASGHDESLFGFLRLFSRISALLLWLLLLADKGQAVSRRNEVQILQAFKSTVSFPIDSSGLWDSWKATDENACAWVGVICTANLTVEELNFNGWTLYGINGGLEGLSELPDLRRLYVSSNELSWDLPDDVGALTQLTHLDFSRNNFWPGSIPGNISFCRSLEFLSLEQTGLVGTIPDLSGLVHLKVLSLAQNNLTGSFPDELGKIKSLEIVDLSGNKLNGSIPSLSNLTNLLDLRLDDNFFDSFEEPASPIAKSLKHLFVSGNQLEGAIPPSMNMRQLQALDMSNNRLTGEIPAGLMLNVNQSFVLDLSQNLLTGNIPIGNVNQSFVLDLSQNLLTGNIPIGVLLSSPDGQSSSLNLSYNSLSGNIPMPLNVSKPLFLYDLLDLSHNQLSGPIPSIGSNENSEIDKLLLQNNRLSGDIADFFLYGPGLISSYELRLQNNLFSGDLSRMVNNWAFYGLEVLDLSNNHLEMSVTKEIPDPLRSTLESFGNMSYTSLSEFRVGGNNFLGNHLPAGYYASWPGGGIMLVLQILDFSNSHLHGEISGVVFNSTWLPALQTLDFSNNSITGNIPESTVQIPSLIVLDVSNNNLSGPLPTILPSSNLYNPKFFEGNALCGNPLQSCPSNATEAFPLRGSNVQWWVYLIIVFAVVVALGSLLVATWRWRVYRNQHQQDADLIKTLMERQSTTLMSLRALKKATDNFAESAQIGEGGFGTVYIGRLIDGTRVAIKRSKHEGSEKDKEQFLNEVKILCQLNHRNLVKLLGCCMENKVALLVFEYVSNGTLQEHLRGKIAGAAHLSWKQRVNIAVQVADALNYLHSTRTLPIYHRDVKAANILLTDDFSAKVADFGLSKLALVEASHVSTIAVQGTMGYIDPEYYTSYQYTSKSDVYSFGVVLLELISAKPPIDFQRGEDETSLVNFANPLVKSGDLERFIDLTLTETYKDPVRRGSIWKVGKLAMRCLEMKSRARPTMNEVTLELQNLYFELYGTSRQLNSIDEDSTGSITIEMPQLSPGTRYEFMCNQGSSGDLKLQIGSPSSNSLAHRSRSVQHSNIEA